MARKASTPSILFCHFLLPVLVLGASPFAGAMDHGKCPREESPEADGPSSYLCAYLCDQG